MRVVIYARVSSDPTEQTRSVTEQIDECRAFAERQGWTVVATFTDNDRSASKYARRERPEYGRLKTFLGNGGADVLLMWEGSRSTRDLRDFLALRDLCQASKIKYAYSGKVYDFDITDDRFSTGLDALLNERESDKTRDRVMRTQRASAAAGRPWGKRPYGYDREYRPLNGERVLVRQFIVEDQAANIREAARRVADGESCFAVAKDFNERGITAPRGGLWDLTQIRRIVTSPQYVAQRVHQGKIVGPGDWPAILDEQVWAQCVARIKDPKRKTTRERAVKHLLSGLARCGGCGSGLRVLKNQGNLSYQCVTSFCVAIKVSTLDDFITGLLMARMCRPEILEILAGLEDEEKEVKPGESLDELKARLAEFYAEAAVGNISATGLASIEARLLPMIEEASRQTFVPKVPKVVYDLAKAPDPDAEWVRMDTMARREVVGALLEIKVGTIGKGHRVFRPARLGESRWVGDPKTWAEHWGTQKA